MKRILQNDEKLTNEKREELLTLLAKVDETEDRQLVLDNAILRYAETRVGYTRLTKKTTAPKRNKKNVAAEPTVAEVKA